MSRSYERLATRPAPSRARLIHLLIEERAAVIAAIRTCASLTGLRMRHGHKRAISGDRDRDQARREIEAEVLTTTTKEATP